MLKLWFHQRYGINELDCTINVYAFGKDDSILGPILQTVSTLPEGPSPLLIRLDRVVDRWQLRLQQSRPRECEERQWRSCFWSQPTITDQCHGRCPCLSRRTFLVTCSFFFIVLFNEAISKLTLELEHSKMI